VTWTPFEWLYCTSSATLLPSSRSTARLAEYVRGFWKSLSKTNTSGRKGAPTSDWGMRFGYAGTGPRTPVSALLRKMVCPRLPLVERDEATESPGMRP
jgi:hypothetical protein